MIRTLRPGDLPALVGLDREVFGDDAWGLPAWEELLAAPGRRAWVAVPDGHGPGEGPGDGPGAGPGAWAGDAGLDGYALSSLVGDFAELLRIAVSPGVRRRGLAGALLAAVREAARGDGADRVLLEVSEANTGAQALYRRHGFVTIDRRPRYYRDDSAALVLEAGLDDPSVERSGRMGP